MDLTTQYLGLTLKSPLVVGAAAPLTEDLSNIPLDSKTPAHPPFVLHSLL